MNNRNHNAEKIEAYRNAYKESNGSIKSLMWNSYLSASNRYRELTSHLNFEKSSILDVGCGFGDIIPFLLNRAETIDYTGIDILPEFIKEARKRYPDFKFKTRNYFDEEKNGSKFDFIICCGALNGNYSDVDILEYRKKCIQKMFNGCIKAASFNMAGKINPLNKSNSSVYYADSMEILKYCTSLSEKIIFKQHYSKKDFSITIFK